MTLAIIVHGGAKTISDDKRKANIDGCTAALEADWAILEWHLVKRDRPATVGCVALDANGTLVAQFPIPKKSAV